MTPGTHNPAPSLTGPALNRSSEHPQSRFSHSKYAPNSVHVYSVVMVLRTPIPHYHSCKALRQLEPASLLRYTSPTRISHPHRSSITLRKRTQSLCVIHAATIRSPNRSHPFVRHFEFRFERPSGSALGLPLPVSRSIPLPYVHT